ncbi:conserved hypothetical protein [Leishmania major strain Friedlin]|uniref:Uncharacterized protein n=1 Tax=Leishmania major TaxID=5664 RepID=E9AET1_LEIMA|nr:conserved hypothetical protein [Leishmania major strain Friedlin]CAG9582457.1 hypothetical_protein_-_conserved [Leishmania major strain Friedlin]CBZ12734.1 conserved hypothetical protein [Leishmania major strain Friedlin]|eukprot:XP_003722501.1 conserved hypothetical protein [Leishmania major strain Friedlin]
MGKRSESGGGDASSWRRHRSRQSDRRNDDDDVGDYGDRHRRRRRDSDSLADRQHHHHHRHRSSRHHHRGSAERREDSSEAMRSERVLRSHHRPRPEHSDSDDEYGSFDDNRLSRRQRDGQQRWERSRSEEDNIDDRRGRREKGKRYRDTAAADDDDDGRQQGRKYRRDGRQSVDEVSRSVSGNAAASLSDRRAYGDRFQAGNSATSPTYSESSTVDWSSRRGRQRMPSLAYDVDQQKRFLGFLDRRDASGSRTAAAAMEFRIGPDGLVQMPPPPMLVRRQNRSRFSATDDNDGNGSGVRQQPQQQQHRRRRPPSSVAPTANTHDEDGDDNSSVASHESLYNDPAAANMGILPDIIPPSNLYRVALCGVDLSVTASHLSSIVAQLLGDGAKLWRVRRPAREMLHAAVSHNHAAQQQPRHQQPLHAPLPSNKSTITSSASSSGVLTDPPANMSSTLHSVDTSLIGVLSCEPSIIGGGGRCRGVLPDADGSSAASGVLGDGIETISGILQDEAVGQQMHKEAKENDEGVLPDGSPLPQPPQPATPAFYLPGLHDVNGPGGMVVLEFTEQPHALRSVQLLNGAYVNGRRVAASM